MMKTTNLPNVADALYLKIQEDGYSKSVIGTARWVIGHFYNYCLSHDISVITVPTAVVFVKECFGFDAKNASLFSKRISLKKHSASVETVQKYSEKQKEITYMVEKST